MICFGVVNAICSILFGSIMKYIGRIPIIIVGCITHGVLIIVLLFWRPSPDSPIIFFVISGLYGVGDAVWQTQINGIYGALFRRNKEAAFSNYRLWESVGFVIAYAYSITLCARMKLYILFSVLILGILGWVIVEIRHTRKVNFYCFFDFLEFFINRFIFFKQERRLKKLENEQNAQQDATATIPEDDETDDEKDDLEEDIVVTHL